MNKNLLGIIAILSLPTTAAWACIEGQNDGLFPPNNIRIPALKIKTIEQDMFNQMLTRAENFYKPIFKEQGLDFNVTRLWSKEDKATVGGRTYDGELLNAFATRDGKNANIYMFGGLARHPNMSGDGFLLVACHEIGHHLGGYPKISGLNGGWASNEGQSDYFATLKCGREIFKNDDNAAIMAKVQVPAIVTEKCQKTFDYSGDVALCQRMSMAGKSLADVLASLSAMGGGIWPSEPPAKAPIDFSTPSEKVVRRIDNSHPEAQCRLDTYFQGSICGAELSSTLSDTDETAGTCNVQRNDELGVRPRCWFVPKTELDLRRKAILSSR